MKKKQEGKAFYRSMLSRAERRREDRKNQKLAKWLMKLDRDQRQLLTEYCMESSKSDILAYCEAYERVLRPELQEVFNDEIKAEKFLEKVIEKVTFEGKALRNFKNGSVEYVANIKSEKENIIKKYVDGIENGKKDKEIREELKTIYPTFTASSIKNVIAEYKRDKKKLENNKKKLECYEELDLDISMDTEEIAAAIINGIEVEEKSENKAHKDEIRHEGKNICEKENKRIDSAREGKKAELKSRIIEVTQVREFVGQYGSYEKRKDGTVQAGKLEFKNANDIEIKKIEVEAEIKAMREDFEKSIAQKREKALGKLEEVMELLSR